MVYATSPPLFVGLAGVIIAAVSRARLVFEVRDLWPESAVALGELNNPRAVRLADGVARLCYRRARCIVAVTRDMVARLEARGIPPRQDPVDPQRGERRAVPARARQKCGPCARSLGLEGKFVVLYAGIHGLAQGMESLVEAARLLAAMNATSALSSSGPGRRRPPWSRSRRSMGWITCCSCPNSPAPPCPPT